MLKNILNLEGAAQLSKAQQSHIFGGGDAFISGGECDDSCQTNSDCLAEYPSCTTFHLNISCPDDPDVKSCI